MEIDLVRVLLVIIIAALAWYANANLNPVPVLKNVVNVLIVVVSVLCLLSAFGVYGRHSVIIHL